ncbi:helix-turn-helix transcriptional regulator [Roseibium sp. SCP14]|uniref:helix-turn-helix transcriptional regulator n=1 Tax=Roseibium sp. SCP14 TaxID=3141375 RepID=UPI0033363120
MTNAIATRIHQRTEAVFRSLVTTSPMVILVREGVKHMATRHGTYTARTGEVFLFPERTPYEIRNKLGPTGLYNATAITIPRAVIPITGERAYLRATNDSRVVGAFERAVIAASDPLVPEPLRAHYVQEVLLWLSELGISFPSQQKESVEDRVRDLVCKSLDHHWKAENVAKQLGLSEASLRRHLARCGTSFSAVLSDARMTRALALLHSTDLSINRIALEVGYASPSQFAARFRDRFEVTPSAIRGGALIESGQELIE